VRLGRREEPAFVGAQQYGIRHAGSDEAGAFASLEGCDRIRRAAQDDGAGRQVLGDDDTKRQETVAADRQAFGNADLAAEKAAIADACRAGDADLRGDEAVIADNAVMGRCGCRST